MTAQNLFSLQGVRIVITIFVLWIISLSSPNVSMAADKCWDGEGSTNNWTEGANWAGNTVPANTDRAIFGGPTCTTGTPNKNVTINSGFNDPDDTGGGILIETNYSGTVTQGSGVSFYIGSLGFEQRGGTFTGASSGDITIQYGGDFLLSGGTFTSTGGILSEYDNWTISGGTFNTNSGTVRITASDDYYSVVSGSRNFNNFSIYSCADNLSIASGTTITVDGTLTLDSHGCGSGVLEGPGSIIANGDITSTSNGITGDGVITISGTGNQTISGDGSSASLPSIVVNKPSGILTYSGTMRFPNDYTYTAGTLSVGTSTVLFSSSYDWTGVITGSQSFYNFTIYSCQDNLSIASGTTITVDGTLTLDSHGCGSGVLEGPGSIIANGDITSTSNGITGDGVITINGVGNQTISGDSSTAAFPSIVVNKSSGVLIFSGTIRFTNDYTYTGGTLNFGTSTVLFTSSYDWTGVITGSQSFYNFTVLSCNDNLAVASGTTLTIDGTLTFDSGGCGSGYVDGPGILAVSGNITIANNGTSGNVPIKILGNKDQTFSSSGGELPDGTFTVNKSDGKFILSSNLSLDGTGQDFIVSVDSVFNLSGAYTLTVDDVTTVSGQFNQFDSSINSGSYTITTTGVWKNSSTGDMTVGSSGVTNSGAMLFGTMSGCGGSDAIAITSTTNGSARTWSGNGSFEIFDVSVRDQNGKVTAYSSTSVSNTNWKFVSSCITDGTATLYYPLNEGTGTTINDATSSLNSAVLNGPVWQDESLCASDKCLLFDGTNDVVSRTYSSDTELNPSTESFTVSMWFRHPSVVSGTDTLITRYASGGYKAYMNSSGTICFGIDDDATSFPEDDACSTASYADSKWHFVEMVKNGTSTLSLYVDGMLVDQQGGISATGSISGSSPTLYVGAGYNGTSVENYWTGSIDEVKFYNYARLNNLVLGDFRSKNNDVGISASFGGSDAAISLSDGLVGYWPMDETAANSCTGGTNDSCDKSGNGVDGAWNGNTTSVNGRYGLGTAFDGTSDYIAIPNTASLNLTNNYTISGWFYDTNANTSHDWQFLIAKGSLYAEADVPYYVAIGYGQISFGHAIGWSTNSLDTWIGSSEQNKWYHFAASFDEGKNLASLYINGVLVETAVDTSVPVGNSSATAIGALSSGTSGFNGYIDDLRIYNRALDGAEISRLYNWVPGPIGYWKFDEGSSSTANDSSGRGYDGSITGSAQWTNGKYGKALTIDGVNDVVSAGSPAAFDNLSALTISYWTQNKNGSDDEAIGKNASHGSSGWGVNNYKDDDIQFEVGYSTSNLYASTAGNDGSANSTYDPSKWYHVAVTWDGSSTTAGIKIYYNGTSVPFTGGNASGSREDDSSQTLEIGNHSWGGNMDDVRLYNYVRTPSQIIQDMNAGHPLVGTPVGSAALHMNFDEGYGTTANNIGTGGSTLNGTLTNMASPATSTSGWTNDGKYYKGIKFDGSNDYINVSSGLALANSSFTLSSWVKRAASGIATTIISSGTQQLVNRMLDFRFNPNNTLHCGFYANDIYSTATYTDSNWHHVACSYNATTKARVLYMDGKVVASDTTSSDYIGGSNLDIGRNSYDGGEYFNGSIDEVKIYLTDLTQTDILSEYNSGKVQTFGATSTASDGKTPDNSAAREYCVPGDASTCNPPVAVWNFDEKSGTTVNDLSGNAFNGSLLGSPSWGIGKIGNAVLFDGTDDRMQVTHNALLNPASYTLSTWFYITGNEGTTRWIVTKGPANNSGSTHYAMLVTNSDRISYQTYEGGTRGCDGSTLTSNRWYYATMTYNATGRAHTGYLNGVLDCTATGTYDLGGTTDHILFGDQIDAGYYGGDYFKGVIDKTTLYSYVRTPEQIAWDYNHGAPLAHWEFDETSGSTAYDSTGNGLNGTLTNSPTRTTSGKFNSGILFDGVDDYITLGNPALLQTFTSMSISAWVKGTNLPVNDYRFIYSKDTAGFYVAIYNKLVRFRSSDLTSDMTDSTTSLNNNTWYFITVTYDGSAVKIYIDGKLDATESATGIISENTGPATIGMFTPATGYFDGTIDDVQIYNYALTSEQIKMVMNQNSAVKFTQ
ncbi:hypothetical protein HGA91_03260 [candidate division WWE3 bacterium]|nr:hypothetical protein [candidate division WWE3 bacterium]